ncbi:MAG: tail fiber protein [Pseudomonadota bacterium]
MSEPFLGEIRMMGFNFNPRGWAYCSGALLPISQNSALFSLLGTIYGGDGRTTFALPDLRGRNAIHFGNGAGLTNRPIGSRGGAEFTTQTISTMANHTHNTTVTAQGYQADGNSNSPVGRMMAQGPVADTGYTIPTDNSLIKPMNANAVAVNNAAAGGQQQQNNMTPFLTVNFCIALQGLFPSRS